MMYIRSPLVLSFANGELDSLQAMIQIHPTFRKSPGRSWRKMESH